MLEVDIKKEFADGFILDINFLINKNTYNILLGPSGAGKSLTLKIIAGFEQVKKGKILLEDCDISNLVPEKRGVVYLPQSMGLFSHLTVKEHLYFPFKARKVPLDKSLINLIVEEFNISNLLNRYPKNLSGGERQRVALARSLLAQPKVLLLDEPLTGLDFHLKMKLIRFLKKIKEKFSLTIIHVTHDPIEALYLGEEIFVLEKGQIIFRGDAKDLFSEKQNGFLQGIRNEIEELKRLMDK